MTRSTGRPGEVIQTLCTSLRFHSYRASERLDGNLEHYQIGTYHFRFHVQHLVQRNHTWAHGTLSM